ncbi:MAG: hypothetical protein M0C28_47875 [Candidatus Moduliflexus flocculans]|nr:hypothetical protein [Candidatus Moduliflexus flocculans]
MLAAALSLGVGLGAGRSDPRASPPPGPRPRPAGPGHGPVRRRGHGPGGRPVAERIGPVFLAGVVAASFKLLDLLRSRDGLARHAPVPSRPSCSRPWPGPCWVAFEETAVASGPFRPFIRPSSRPGE